VVAVRVRHDDRVEIPRAPPGPLENLPALALHLHAPGRLDFRASAPGRWDFRASAREQLQSMTMEDVAVHSARQLPALLDRRDWK